MPPVTADDVLKSVSQVKEIMQDGLKSMDEKIAQAQGVAEQALAQVKAHRAEFASPNSPMTLEQGEFANQRGGLFEGRFKLGYEKMIGLPASNPALLPRDKERLRSIQDLHDAVAIRVYSEMRNNRRASYDQIMENVSKSTDFQMFAAHLVQGGYVRTAHDILNPAGGTGVNLDYTLLSAQMIDLISLHGMVAPQFRTIPLTRAKQEFPAIRGHAYSVLGGGAGVALPANDPAAVGAMPPASATKRPVLGQVNFNCIHNLGFMAYTDDMIQDSVVPFLSLIRDEAAIMIARGRDAAIINGDAQATHIDTDTTDTFDIRKAWNGLRRLATNNKIGIDAAITSADFFEMMAGLGKYATNPQRLVMFLNVIDWLKLSADSALKTVDSIGIDRATLRQGVIDRVAGINIVVTEEIRRDLDVDGEYDGTPTDNTIEILCNTDRFWIGQMGTVKTEEVRVAQALANWIQVDVREDFKPLDIDDTVSPLIFAAGVAPVVVGINVTV
jgi:hypothetical protein